MQRGRQRSRRCPTAMTTTKMKMTASNPSGASRAQPDQGDRRQAGIEHAERRERAVAPERSAASPGWRRSAAPAAQARQSRQPRAPPAAPRSRAHERRSPGRRRAPCTRRPHSQLSSSATTTTSTANGITPENVKSAATAPMARPEASRWHEIAAEARTADRACAGAVSRLVVLAHPIAFRLSARRVRRSIGPRRRRSGGRACGTRRSPARSSSRPKSGQIGIEEHELGIGRLPQQEVRQPQLAAGADEQIGIGHAVRCRAPPTAPRA